MTQTRWFCASCQREWVSGPNHTVFRCGGTVPWTADLGCPVCESAAIERLTYTPAFLGGDLPRGGQIESPNRVVAPIAEHVPKDAPNRTLALSCPEFG